MAAQIANPVLFLFLITSIRNVASGLIFLFVLYLRRKAPHNLSMPDAPTDAIIEDGDYSSYAAVGIKTDYVAAVGF